jgi:ABC-2 type transport system permease protein
MNTGVYAGQELAESPVISPAAIPLTHRIYWAIKRELWESRSIYISPVGVAVIILLGFAVTAVHLSGDMRAAALLDPAKQRAAITLPYELATAALMITGLIVGIVYSLEALYGERRDRSILFWKSLPVSDLATVLAKASVPIVILPVLFFAITLATQTVMLLVSTAILASTGGSVSLLWTQLSLFQNAPGLLYHFLAIHGIGAAPLYAWLFLVSAWARRAPFVWAFVPPLAVGYLEKLVLNTTHFFDILKFPLMGNAAPGQNPTMIEPMTLLTPARFLASPALWIGLAITAVFLAAAVRLRRAASPI